MEAEVVFWLVVSNVSHADKNDTQIDNDARVMISGATGYVAGWIVRRLLENGHTVHAAVRDPDNPEKLKYLNELADKLPGQVRYFSSDLLRDGSYANAMQGCQLVFHTASPFTSNVRDPRRELIEPARRGTRNVLQQANQTDSVRRIVLTSSCAAIYGDNIDLLQTRSGEFTEEDWNVTSSVEHQAYSYSKTLAEREAWRMVGEQDRWDLVVINPSLVIGPGINPYATSESFTLIKQMGDGTFRMGVPDYGIGVVDVRDLADAHMRAGYTPTATGRHIISAHNTSFREMVQPLIAKYGNAYPFPKRTLPKWFVWLVGPMLNKAMTHKVVNRNVGYPFVANNGKSIRELGMQYRSLEELMTDFFQQLIDSGAFA